MAARDWLRSLEGRSVRVQFEQQRREQHGRALVHCYLLPDGPDLATEILSRHWGVVCAIEPNATRRDAWRLAAKEKP